MIGALGIFVIVLSFIPLTIFRGWVISWLWLWFAVPLGAPTIGVAWAIGLSSLTGLFQHVQSEAKAEDDNPLSRLGKAYSKVILYPVIALLAGWLAHAAMTAN